MENCCKKIKCIQDIYRNTGTNHDPNCKTFLSRSILNYFIWIENGAVSCLQLTAWINSLCQLTNIACGQTSTRCSITNISIWHFKSENIDMKICSKHAKTHEQADWSIKHVNVPEFLCIILYAFSLVVLARSNWPISSWNSFENAPFVQLQCCPCNDLRQWRILDFVCEKCKQWKTKLVMREQ